MKLSEIEQRLVPWYLTSLEKDGNSYLLRGKTGRGKTSVISQIPARLEAHFPDKKFGIVVINGACVTLTTTTGYLWPEEKDGVRYSQFTRPSWWLTQEGKPLEAYNGGVIFVDEEDKLGLDEKKIMGEGALSKRLGNHDLPPGWVIWFAGQPASDRSGSTKQFDHLIQRRKEIEVTDDIASTLAWYEKHEVLEETLVFAEENPNIVFMAAPEKQGPFCTPRSLYQSDRALQVLMDYNDTEEIPTDGLAQEELAASIGAGAAAQYMAVVKLGQELPKYAVIVKSPTTCPVPTKPDARRLAAYKLASQVSKKDIGAVLTYVGRLPDEFQLIFGRSAVQRDYALVALPEMARFCLKHASLLALVDKLK